MLLPHGHGRHGYKGATGDSAADAPAGEEATKGMYTDDYIRRWEPLEPLEPDRMTDAHSRAIAEKMLKRNAVVYNRLAEL